MNEKIISPHSWNAGPPRSDTEGWRWQRRMELRDITAVLLARIGTPDQTINTADECAERYRESAKLAFAGAKEILRLVDLEMPRL